MGVGKPHPDIFLKCLEDLGVQPQNSLVFEDSFSGVKSALSAGAKVIAITTSHEASEFEGVEMAIPDFTEMNFEIIKGFIKD